MKTAATSNLIGFSTNAVADWEQQVEQLANIDRLSPIDYLNLRRYLHNFADADSYLTSPFYYFFTGRNGLWSYSKKGCKILFAWHPNRDGQIVIFPPVDRNAQYLINHLLSILPPPPDGLMIGRVKTTSDLMSELAADSQNFSWLSTPCEEEVLDWRYPVRVLSTAQVRRAAGRKFNNIRSGVIRATKYGPVVQKIGKDIYRKDVTQLLHNWASRNAMNREEYFDLFEAYDSLFSLSLSHPDLSEGLAVYIEGRLEAIALWDVSPAQEPSANLYAYICNTKFYGLSEFVLSSVCQILDSNGISLLNLGGSETASLDFFKQKFRPVHSIGLCSIKLEPVIDFGQFAFPFRRLNVQA